MNRLDANMFFICGAPKSGTTWLQRLMNSHPEVVCKGEGHFIEKFVLPMAEVFRGHNAKMSLVADAVYSGNPYYRQTSNDEFFRICHDFIFNKIAEGEKGTAVYFGDKTPRYYEYIRNIKNIYPKSKIICILRDPRDLVVSRFYHAARAGVEGIFTVDSESRKSQIKLTISQFINCVSIINDAKDKYNNDIFITKYESLIGNSIFETKEIFKFLGANSDSELIERIVLQNSFQSMTNRRPGEMDKESFLRKGIVGDWVNEITDEEEKFIRETVMSKVDVDYFNK